ncbi:MAG: ferrous iron transport protein A [Pegethrix bostrychoides GSE-TBD4-15B]|jgi:ferrous iron transport protein A|uniref:Ferrous iron transport protein A n=1 Tax=Pegethrix bostrychoides GSE-TBD4-15B TaxID=2839662 RepID=A0A951U716_9CYAN|nr:ferrous iron transport protein A [Pegethrix bostrychoides GSE-TBD4-15B]
MSKSSNPDPHVRSDVSIISLTTTKVGDHVRIVSLNCGESNSRLMGMGFIPDAVLEVISCPATGSVIVALQDQRLGLGADMAQQIQVIDAAHPLGRSHPLNQSKQAMMETTPQISTVKLRNVAIGSVVRVVGYEPTARDYKRKLLAMGLTPGTELRVTRHAPLGDPTEIEVRDFHLTLRKHEADALLVTPVTGGAS